MHVSILAVLNVEKLACLSRAGLVSELDEMLESFKSAAAAVLAALSTTAREGDAQQYGAALEGARHFRHLRGGFQGFKVQRQGICHTLRLSMKILFRITSLERACISGQAAAFARFGRCYAVITDHWCPVAGFIAEHVGLFVSRQRQAEAKLVSVAGVPTNQMSRNMYLWLRECAFLYIYLVTKGKGLS